MKTKLFLDSGDPSETKQLLEILGSLDGQTTNPTLVSKNPDARARLERGDKFTKDEIYSFYKDVITEISGLIPKGSVSIEVYADVETTAGEMIDQARQMYTWIPNAHIKLPTTAAGLTAAETLSEEGMRLNMTLVFTQAQAAAVYAATRSAKKGDVFLSPFIGRLDDKGENGMDLIANCIKMYEQGDGHVEVLSASARTMDHFLAVLQLGSDIITVPYKLLQEWAHAGKQLPDENFSYAPEGLAKIEYQTLDLSKSWKDFTITHALTDAGLARFADDWNALMA